MRLLEGPWPGGSTLITCYIGERWKTYGKGVE
jgi:hypothetical protein